MRSFPLPRRRLAAPRRAVRAALLACGAALYAQAADGGGREAAPAPAYQNPAACDPFELISLRLADVFGRFGPPASVYAARGEQPWQDDVVLEYKGVDFYIYNGEVWQVGLAKALGIAAGDPRQAVPLVFKDAAREEGGAFAVSFDRLPWPARLRVTLDKNGKVAALYIYRAHY